MTRTSHIWEDDPLSASLIEKMQLSSSIELDAKEYLRPIFKWTKQGSKSYDLDRANAFAEYLVTVSRVGDADRNIPANKSIQAKYAFNIMITMAQRRGSGTDAWLCYQRIQAHGFEPDVFTMTALIDVIGRSDSSAEGICRAMDLFHAMRTSRNCLPNVITFVTVFRALGKAKLHVIGAKETHLIVLELLSCAHEISADDESSLPPRIETEKGFFVTVDITIYNAALSTCVWLGYPSTGLEILSQMARRGSKLNPVSHKIVGKLITCYNRGAGVLGEQWFAVPDGDILLYFLSVGAVTADEATEISKLFAAHTNKEPADSTVKRASLHSSSSQYAGCLGSDAAEDLRQCVIDHDLRKLIERPEGFSESDFATLIHQCRKRKWHSQVQSVLSFMTQRVALLEEPSSTFNPSPSMPSTSHPWLSTESSHNLRRCIVALTWTIYEAAFDAYFCLDMGAEAFALYHTVLGESADSPALSRSLLHADNMAFILKGFFRCGLADCAVFAFESSGALSLPPRQLVMGLMHGLGRGSSVPVALSILAALFAKSCCLVGGKVQSLRGEEDPSVELSQETPPFSLQTCQVFLVTLLESCAVLGDVEGFTRVLSESLPSAEMSLTCLLLRDLMDREDCDFVSVCLMAAAAEGSAGMAHDYLVSWQSTPLRYLPPYLFLHGLVAESFAQTASSGSQSTAAARIRSLPFKGFARVGAVRHLDKRRGFIRKSVPKCVLLRGRGGEVADIFSSVGSVGRDSSGWRASLQYVMDEGEEMGMEGLPVSVMNVQLTKTDTVAAKGGAGISEEDMLLTHYLLAALDIQGTPLPHRDLKAGQTGEHSLSCVLLLQHLETRLLRVRDKEAKGLLHRQIVTSFSAALQMTSTAHPSETQQGIDRMQRHAHQLVKMSLHAMSALDLNGKQSSRLLGSLLDGMDCWFHSKAEALLFDAPLLSEITAAEPCLDVLKELQRMFLVLDTQGGAAAVSGVLLTLLEKDKEKLVKVVMFMQQQRLFPCVDQDKLESLLVAALRNSPEGSWSAVMAYFTGVVDDPSDEAGGAAVPYARVLRTRDACKRIVRKLLADSDASSAAGGKEGVTIACRLLCKYDLSDDAEFRPLFLSVREVADGPPAALGALGGTSEAEAPCLSAFYPRDNILWVDGSDMDMLSRATDILLHPPSRCDVVGIDVEWRPFSTGTQPWPCSLLQIGCRTHCFLFDLVALEGTGSALPAFSSLLSSLFLDPSILKLGFGLAGDFKRLGSSYPSSPYDFSSLCNVHDIASSPLCRGRGLSAVCLELLGHPLDKRFQLSDWQRRPLLEDQMVYAATDAGVLIAIYDAMRASKLV